MATHEKSYISETEGVFMESGFAAFAIFSLLHNIF